MDTREPSGDAGMRSDSWLAAPQEWQMKDGRHGAPSDGLTTIPHLLRLPAVLHVTGLGRSTLYKMIAEHRFPAPVRLSTRAVGWRHDDVRHWADARPGTTRS
jgi:prophage regulatory protein